MVAWFARNQRLHVPAVWPLEFANALWQLQRRKLLSGGQVYTIIDLAEPLDIVVHGETLRPRRLAEVARNHDLTAYDASYLDLALTLRYPVACRDGCLGGVQLVDRPAHGALDHLSVQHFALDSSQDCVVRQLHRENQASGTDGIPAQVVVAAQICVRTAPAPRLGCGR